MSRACDVVLLGALTGWPSAGRPGNILVGQSGAISGRVALVRADGAAVEVLPSSALPAAPSAVLLDAANPNTFVGLGAGGVGEALSAAAARSRLGFPGLPSVSLSDLANPDTFVMLGAAGAGESATPQQVLELLGLTWDLPLGSSAGWTLRAGDGAAAIVGGAARLSLGAGVVPAAWANQPMGAYTHGRSLAGIDLCARLSSWTGGNAANTFAALGLRLGAAGATGLFANVYGDGSRVELFGVGVSGDGGGGTSFGNVALNRATVASGQWWVRLVLSGFGATLYQGTGVAGAPPSSWSWVGGVASGAGWSTSTIGAVVADVNANGGGSPDAMQVEWTSVSIVAPGLTV